MSSYNRHGYVEKVGKLDLKSYQHWRDIDREYWATCGLDIRPEDEEYGYYYNMYNNRNDYRITMESVMIGLVQLQRNLVKASKCEKNEMVLSGYMKFWNDEGYHVKGRVPYHEDLLPNWKAFIKKVKKSSGIKQFHISNVMLPTSPFFSTQIMPILNDNITTIISLELQNCDIKSNDMECIAKYIKKNSSLVVLNLSGNALFGIYNDASTAGAKVLSKGIKKHPGLSLLNLSKTGLEKNNDALKIVLEGSNELNSLIINDNRFDSEGLEVVSKILQKKKAITILGMERMGIAEGEKEDSIAKAKALKQLLQKNSTLEQLSLASNLLGVTGLSNRVLSTVMSGIKGSTSLIHVDLSCNEIRRLPSIKVIAKFLANNPALIELDMRCNGIPARSADVLMEALKSNTNLEYLSLRQNNITDKSVPAFTDALKNNTTLLSLDLSGNNLKVETGRKGMLKALCDVTSLDSIANGSNHTCTMLIAGTNYGKTYEEEFAKINALENEGEKIRYKVVLALCVLNKELYNPRSFDDIPLELMPKLLALLQQEIGCNGFGEGIVKSVRKRNTINRLRNVYEAIHQWPDFPLLFSRGPGKKKRKAKRKLKAADEEEDWAPKAARKSGESSNIAVGSGRSKRSGGTAISYADAENSEDES